MKKSICALILLFAIVSNVIAQKAINPVIPIVGAPSITDCIYGRIYIDVNTGNLYTYKVTVGCILAGNTSSISGSGTANRITFWNGANSLGSTSGFTFSSNNLSIPAGGQFQINGSAFNFTNLAGNIAVSQMNSGTSASSLTYWRGDGTWATLPANGATTALDNLASVNINSTLLAQSGVDLGSTTKPFKDLYLYGSGTYGTNYFRFTGTPTSSRNITLPDLANYTLAQITNAQTFAGNQTFTGIIQVGGSSSSFPGLNNSGTTLQIVKADSSAFTDLKALSISTTSSGGGVNPATTNIGTIGTASLKWNGAYINNIIGTITNDNASSGAIGEYVTSSIASGSAISLTTATPANITSISLTTGDWDVRGNCNFNDSAATVTATQGGISSTSATLPIDGTEVYSGVQLVTASALDSVSIPSKRFNLSATTTIYLVCQQTFSIGTANAFGSISARRVR